MPKTRNTTLCPLLHSTLRKTQCSKIISSSRSESPIALGIVPQFAATGSLFSPRSRRRAAKSLAHSRVHLNNNRRILAKGSCVIRAFRAIDCHSNRWYRGVPTTCSQLFVLLPNSTIWSLRLVASIVMTYHRHVATRKRNPCKPLRRGAYRQSDPKLPCRLRRFATTF